MCSQIDVQEYMHVTRNKVREAFRRVEKVTDLLLYRIHQLGYILMQSLYVASLVRYRKVGSSAMKT